MNMLMNSYTLSSIGKRSSNEKKKSREAEAREDMVGWESEEIMKLW